MTPDFSCERCQDSLPWYVANSLANDERAAMERHLASCARCRAALDEWREVGAALHRADEHIPLDTASVATWAHISHRLEAQTAQIYKVNERTSMSPQDTNTPNTPTPVGVSTPVHPRRRVHAFVSLVVALALIAVSVGVFSILAARGIGNTGGSNTAKRGYNVARCDGSPIAHAPLSEQPPNAPASVYVDTRAAATSGNSGISALAAQDGTPRWCVRFALTPTFTCPPGVRCPPPPRARVGMPLVAGNVVYVCVSGGAPGVLYALNAANGALRWSRETDCQVVDIPVADGAQPILAGGMLYSGMFGLAPADGSVRWHLPPQVASSTIGAVADGVAYAYNDNTISAVRLTDSTVAWTYTLDASLGSRPVTVGAHLYVGDIAGNSPPVVTLGLPDTYAFDTRTGAILWRSPTGIVAGSSPVEVAGLVYIGAENALFALDAATGAIRWRVQVAHGGSVQNTPVVSNGVVYFLGDGAYAVDATTGAVRWHNALGWDVSHRFTGTALRDNTLYLVGADGSGRGTLYALDTTSGAIRWQRSDIHPEGMPVA